MIIGKEDDPSALINDPPDIDVDYDPNSVDASFFDDFLG